MVTLASAGPQLELSGENFTSCWGIAVGVGPPLTSSATAVLTAWSAAFLAVSAPPANTSHATPNPTTKNTIALRNTYTTARLITITSSAGCGALAGAV